MPHTPCFPSLRPWLTPSGRSFAHALTPLGRCTLAQIEQRLGRFVTSPALQPNPSDDQRPYSLRRTFWCFVWQMLSANSSCREVVRQLQAALALDSAVAISEQTGGYCLARPRIPLELLEQTLLETCRTADRLIGPGDFLQGRAVKAIDCTTLTLPDTAANQRLYPQQKPQLPGCGFPLLKVMAVWSLQSGALSHAFKGNNHQHEMRLLHTAAPAALAAGDIVIYDRAAGHYVAAAQVRAQGADLISRVMRRKIDWRKGQRLGPNERLVVWPKTETKPGYMSAQAWAHFPEQLTVRVIRVRIHQKGFRARELVLVTTLLDPQRYPLEQIVQAYHRRWRLEMCLDDLKTTLGLDRLRCQSPAMVYRELLVLLIAHNLIRAIMAEAATAHDVPLPRISFKGTLDAFRHFSLAIAQCRNPAARRGLWQQLLRTIAANLVPERPNRCEPRAVKRRRKAYPLLVRPRHLYRNIRHTKYSKSIKSV